MIDIENPLTKVEGFLFDELFLYLQIKFQVMRKILIAIAFLSSLSLQAQKKYKALYEMAIQFKPNILKINPDSLKGKEINELLQDSVTKQAITETLQETVETLLGTGVRIKVTVKTVDDLNNNIKMEDDEDSHVKMHLEEDGVPYMNNGSWVKPNPENNKLDTLKNSLSATKFTGNKKIILGYECYEIEVMKDSKDIGLAWVCKELPNSLNPFIPIKNSSGAILEYATKDQKTTYILKELKAE